MLRNRRRGRLHRNVSWSEDGHDLIEAHAATASTYDVWKRVGETKIEVCPPVLILRPSAIGQRPWPPQVQHVIES